MSQVKKEHIGANSRLVFSSKFMIILNRHLFLVDNRRCTYNVITQDVPRARIFQHEENVSKTQEIAALYSLELPYHVQILSTSLLPSGDVFHFIYENDYCSDSTCDYFQT